MSCNNIDNYVTVYICCYTIIARRTAACKSHSHEFEKCPYINQNLIQTTMLMTYSVIVYQSIQRWSVIRFPLPPLHNLNFLPFYSALSFNSARIHICACELYTTHNMHGNLLLSILRYHSLLLTQWTLFVISAFCYIVISELLRFRYWNSIVRLQQWKMVYLISKFYALPVNNKILAYYLFRLLRPRFS